jgi:NAD(P)H-flavin reductase
MRPSSELPSEVIKFITDADTVFIASLFKSDRLTADIYPSHAGMNARGGLPGFIRVSPSDRRTVVVPDFSGNRFLSSLGNIESSRLVGLTIVSFTTGDVLYLTGTAQVLVGPPALDIMPKQACVITMETTGFTFVRDALPVRQAPGIDVERSPYSPKIKYLREEPEALKAGSGLHMGRLSSAVQYADDIATFRFEVVSKPGAEPLKIRPGQAIVLDFMDWIGPPQYQHMANNAPGSINDDRVRTWTVSSTHEHGDVKWFELTMREMKGGAVTGALFKTLREEHSNHEERSVSLYARKINSEIVGVTGDFFLGPGFIKMLWVAGGVGITPFMAMLNALVERCDSSQGDVVLALSTREPKVFLELIKAPLRSLTKIRITLDLFTDQDTCLGDDPVWKNVEVHMHKGRIQQQYWKEVAGEREVFICGPAGLGDAAVDGLRAAGVPNDKIHREGFY